MAKLLSEHVGNIAVLYCNRPEVGNSIDLELATGLHAAVRAALSQASALCLRGSGGVFCAGADPAALARADAAELLTREMREIVGLLRSAPIPVIAYVEGAASGGGAELASVAHLLCATAGASFQFDAPPSANWGGDALSRRIGSGRALEILVSGRRLGAAAARSIGLVDRVLTPPEFAEFLQLRVLQDKTLARAARLTLCGGRGLQPEAAPRAGGAAGGVSGPAQPPGTPADITH